MIIFINIDKIIFINTTVIDRSICYTATYYPSPSQAGGGGSEFVPCPLFFNQSSDWGRWPPTASYVQQVVMFWRFDITTPASGWRVELAHQNPLPLTSAVRVKCCMLSTRAWLQLPLPYVRHCPHQFLSSLSEMSTHPLSTSTNLSLQWQL
jgi:hypothetical protein